MLTTTNQIEVRVIDVHESYIHIRAYVWINDPFVEFKIKCALKEAVHDHLKHSMLVDSYRLGVIEKDPGGPGVTWVTLDKR